LVGAAANMGRAILMVRNSYIFSSLHLLNMPKLQRISGQRIVASLRQAAYTQVLRQDMAWHDLRGQMPAQKETNRKSDPPSTGFSSPPSETGSRGTGDTISRLGSDAGIVGESLTRELSEGLRYVTVQTNGSTRALIMYAERLSLRSVASV
jgi:ABC-type multidrug transport system fused ATPase/permease subunit